MDALTKAFLEWANRKGYDTAHAYNQNESRWIFLSPMTADVYEAWQAARTVPDGFVVVPVEPTQEMLKKSGLYDDDTIEVNCAASMAGQIYRAMLAAAPKKEGE